MDQDLYDDKGNLQCIQITNADGSNTYVCVGCNGWAEWIAKNPMPPMTGTPTYQPPAPSADEVSFKALLAKADNIQAADVLPLLKALIKTRRLS